MFEKLIQRDFQVQIHSHANAILSVDFPEAVDELEEVIVNLTIPIEEIIGSGGGETLGTQRLRRGLVEKGWNKINFVVEKSINGVAREAISHEIDHIKFFKNGVVALEIEWNNKDPFFDRDLENFKRLHADGAISVGIIVTRGKSMQEEMREMVLKFAREKDIISHEDLHRIGLTRTLRQQKDVERRMNASGASFAEAWSALFVADKFGAATTHWSKLEDRVYRGVGNPCPLVLIGLPASIVTFGENLDLSSIADNEVAILAKEDAASTPQSETD